MQSIQNVQLYVNAVQKYSILQKNYCMVYMLLLKI